MPTNLENSAVATGLEKVHFHSNLKESPAQIPIAASRALTAEALVADVAQIQKPRALQTVGKTVKPLGQGVERIRQSPHTSLPRLGARLHGEHGGEKLGDVP